MTHLLARRTVRRTAGGLLVLSLAVLLAGCDEPFIVMSGGELIGEVTDPPADWTALNESDVVQLEVRPDDPYSVNVWMIGKGPNVYVATGDGETNWTGYIEHNPDVRLRIDGRIYELEATRVLDQVEKIDVGHEYVKKYGVDEDDNWVENGQLFRLDRR